jgi:hypothetical protein
MEHQAAMMVAIESGMISTFLLAYHLVEIASR